MISVKYADPVKNLRLALYPLGDVTQWFSENAALYASMGLAGHNGIDIVRPHGEHMFAVEDGIILDVKSTADGYGKHFRLVNFETGHEWTYGHCDGIYVKQGQVVRKGQFLATMGNTGFVVSGNTPYWGSNPFAGTHVHFGLRELYLDKKGWSYPGSKVKVQIKNYDNGYKGAIDPLPVLRDPSLASSKIEALARRQNSMVYLQASELLRKLSL